MSDETNVSVPEVEATPAETTPPKPGSKTIVAKPNYTLELNKFSDGANKGFQFWNLQFKDLNSAIEHFTTKNNKGEKGENLILALVNSAMSFRLRAQATSRLQPPNDKNQGGMDPKEKLTRLNEGGDKLVIISQEEAEAYVPGQRDVESYKAKIATGKQIQDAKAKGADKDTLKELIKKYKDLDTRIKDLQAAEENRLLDGLDISEV
jgi:hypothetical protein